MELFIVLLKLVAPAWEWRQRLNVLFAYSVSFPVVGVIGLYSVVMSFNVVLSTTSSLILYLVSTGIVVDLRAWPPMVRCLR